uniref:Amino acid transporter transmembrane domain-containing protein n=1 Tax=Pseudo-nitzschia australis TaxID=44445 RepID=A0A7S4AYE5_9STRA|mmetsp:Transcript_9004/g.19435  ORF Transcript_9004/g.19435 Transcript_9004/m.19435 type:complete len:473 (-) Transcript_9004:118-1536(-)
MAKSDILFPEFDSPTRKSTIVVASFNLTATIMGGGILSIPFAFSKTGILLGPLLMLVAAIATERCMYLICLCSRQTGAKTFGEVAAVAFGKKMEYFIAGLLCVFLMFAIIGYMVLAKDIWMSIISVIGNMDTAPNDELVLAAIIVLIVPFLVQKSLYALRFNCYVGFVSVSILCFALVRHAWTAAVWPDPILWSTNFEDILIAFPIISLSFLGIFNVLPIQNALVTPSRSRILFVVDGAISTVLVISLLFGLAGYLLAGSKTDGNILNNCDTANNLNLLLGQMGCGTMVVLAIPIMTIPCRSSLLEVLDVLVNGPHITPVEMEETEKLPLIASDANSNDNNYNATDTASDQQNQQKEQTAGEGKKSTNQNKLRKVNITDNAFIHYASTFFIFASCYMVAIRVPGVAVVWAILGCSMGYFISFVFPCACYLKIQKLYPAHASDSKVWSWFAWTLLVMAVASMVACTAEVIKRL